MKKLIIFIVFAMLFGSVFISHAIDTEGYDTVTLSKNGEIPTPFCPVTKISDNKNCMDCHVMKMQDGKPVFGLMEIPISAGYKLPYGCSISKSNEGILSLYYQNTGTAATAIRAISDYMYEHPEFTRFIMEMHSGGGSVMDAWRAAGIIEEMRGRGIEIETRTYGMAASAGTILLVSGDIGKRFVNPHAEIMLHKLWTFKMFSIDDPDTSEDQAELMKHFQGNINSYILDRTNLDKDVLEKNMFKKDWWVTGKQCVELGIVDGFIE